MLGDSDAPAQIRHRPEKQTARQSGKPLNCWLRGLQPDRLHVSGTGPGGADGPISARGPGHASIQVTANGAPGRKRRCCRTPADKQSRTESPCASRGGYSTPPVSRREGKPTQRSRFFYGGDEMRALPRLNSVVVGDLGEKLFARGRDEPRSFHRAIRLTSAKTSSAENASTSQRAYAATRCSISRFQARSISAS